MRHEKIVVFPKRLASALRQSPWCLIIAAPDQVLNLAARVKAMSVPEHLILLHLDGKKMQVVLAHIRDDLKASADQCQHIRQRFENADWRGHLISAVAMLLADDCSNLPVADLWSSFDGGSWVAPQLAATASLVDKDFIRHARTRVEARCPITVPNGLSPLERHVATGPHGEYHRRCKALAALLTLLRNSPAQSDWIDAISQNDDISSMLKDDADEAGLIAKYWQINAIRELRAFGITLEPAG